MPDWNVKANDIFLRAVEVEEAAARAGLLDDACGGDAELREQVERLLRAGARAGSFLESPAEGLGRAAETVDRLSGEVIREGPGTVVGRYKLLEQIGEGGFGVVFMAEQGQPVRRRVALKVVKAGMDTRQVITRFEAERQALAVMDHPNIAKVFDAGMTESGRPYFVMELVKGVPITRYCDEHRLMPRQRLELFVSVCEAVQHAHQKGIIHRDLKPTNVLVAAYDDRAVAKVIDFGVAKARGVRLTERTMFTGFGDVIGTLEYMSPEQAELNQLDVDTRSDIYSLGVLLYELLTGTTPLERKRLTGSSLVEALRVIREEEPPKPSARLSTAAELPSIAACRGLEPRKLSGVVQGELDWIVMKCLEKDRARRYETATGLARDVERHLSDEPVQAGPPSAAYRLRKFVSRNKGPVLAAGLVLAVLLAGISATTWQAVQATRARDRIADEKRRGDEEAAVARAINDFLNQDVLGSANAYTRAGQGGAAGPDPTVREALDRAAANIEARFATQPRVNVELRTTIGTAYRSLGALPKAEAQFQAALDLSRRTWGDRDFRTLNSIYWLALTQLQQGNAADSEPLLRAAAAGFRETVGAQHRRTFDALEGLACVYEAQGRFAEAERAFLEVLDGRRKSLGPSDADTLASLNNLAGLRYSQGRFNEAGPLFADALDGFGKTLGDRHPYTLNALINLGSVREMQGRLDDAAALYERALEGRRAAMGENHPDTLKAIFQLAVAHRGRGRLDEAEKLLKKAVEAQGAALGERHFDTLASLHSLGEMYLAWGRLADAEPLLDQVIAGSRQTFGEDHLYTINALYNLASLRQKQGRFEEAETLWQRVHEGRRAKLGPAHRDTLASLNSLGTIYLLRGRLQEAERAYDEALAGFRKALGNDHPDTLVVLHCLAQLRQFQGRDPDGEKLLLEVIDVRRRRGEQDPLLFGALKDLAAIYLRQGRFKEAEPLFSQALAGYSKVLGDDHADVNFIRQNLALVREKQRAKGPDAQGRPPQDAETAAGKSQPAVPARPASPPKDP